MDHPRVGGETHVGYNYQLNPWGPSPRGRGNHTEILPEIIELGTIPAWAGKPLSASVSSPSSGDHPHVGGETSGSVAALERRTGPSSRGRGNPSVRLGWFPALGTIPTWAGKP